MELNLDLNKLLSKKNMFTTLVITVITVSIITLVVNYFYCRYFKIEKMENVSEADQKLIDNLYEYFSSGQATDYLGYLGFLESIKNTNLEIINSDTFSTLKTLQKKQILSKDDVARELKLQK